nr:MAG TPA: hypothetical protein [Caudoviricetes sp.]
MRWCIARPLWCISSYSYIAISLGVLPPFGLWRWWWSTCIYMQAAAYCTGIAILIAVALCLSSVCQGSIRGIPPL